MHLLEKAVAEFDRDWQETYEILIVDDGSKDETTARAKAILGQIAPKAIRAEVIPLTINQGKGGALQKGVEQATGKYVLTLDADMAAHPLELMRWLDFFKAATFPKDTILIGSRNHKDSEIEAKSYRKATGTVYNLLIRSVTPIQESDTQCGFKLYPAPFAKLLFSSLNIKGWAHDIEILYKAFYLGIPVISMPIHWQHIEGEKISVLKDGLQMAIKTIGLSWQFRFSTEMKIELRNLMRQKMSMDSV